MYRRGEAAGVQWNGAHQNANGSTTVGDKIENKDAGSESQKPRIDWEDPAVPIGDAPPLPRWPLYLTGALWAGSIVFLFVMLLSRTGVAE